MNAFIPHLSMVTRAVRHGLLLACLIVAALPLLVSSASSQRLAIQQGIAALNRGEYVLAARIITPLAESGDMVAQDYLGIMFETGRGVPQNYTEAAMWYRRSAEQGYGAAQYSLGLLYDKGQGVPRNVVEASKWLNLAASVASSKNREARLRIRDAVGTKMTRGEIARARLRALEWAPTPERY